MKAIASWSGGKDSCLACYNAIKNGFEIKYLLNTISDEYGRSLFHGVRCNLLKMQSRSMAIPIIQIAINEKDYEEKFIDVLRKVKKEKKVDYGIFGDIDLAYGKKWVEKICKKSGIKPVFPLWKRSPEKIMNEFIEYGFKAIVVSANSKFFGKDILGRKIDKDFVKDLKRSKTTHICGENGEYHTFVYDGPIFRKKINFNKGKKVLRPSGYWFLDIKNGRQHS